MSVKTKACSLLVCFSMVVSSLAVPVLADSTVNAGNAAVEAGYTAADAVNAAWDAAAEAGNTVADVGDVAGDAAVEEISTAGSEETPGTPDSASGDVIVNSDVVSIPAGDFESSDGEVFFDENDISATSQREASQGATSQGAASDGSESVIYQEAVLFDEEPALQEESGDEESLNGATSLAGAVVSYIKAYYRVEEVNGTYYLNGRKQSSLNFSFVFDYSIRVGNTYLTENKDFKLSGTLNHFIGAGSVTFTGIGNYTGTKTVAFRWSQLVSIFGTDRYETAVAIANEKYDSSSTFQNIVLVTGKKFPDALSANAFAGLFNAPLLLTQPEGLPSCVRTFINTYKSKIKAVTFIGAGLDGSKAEVRSLLPGATIQEISGVDRLETANEVCKTIIKAKGTQATNGTVFVATGYNPADALSVSPWSYYYEYPILLTDKNGMASEETKALISKFKTVILLGQEAQVSSSVVSHVKPTRLYGNDRYETSRKVVSYFLPSYKSRISSSKYAFVTIASGLTKNYPDALAGGQLMAPVLLVNDSHASIPSEVRNLKPYQAGYAVYYYFLGAAGKDKGTMYEKVAKNIES